jgi:alpha,alpha-trehalase
MNQGRRQLLATAGSTLLVALTTGTRWSTQAAAVTDHAPVIEIPPIPKLEDWEKLDGSIRSWWDSDITQASENEVRAGTQNGPILFLPFQYVRIYTEHGQYQEMFPFDTAFMNYALLAHQRFDRARDHIRNYLFQIERYGYMPNANHPRGLTRSQPPFIPTTIWLYYPATRNRDLLYQAYPLLKREYLHYWNASHHQTPIGLATCRDLGDPSISPALAAEAETGMDWMPIYDGDVRRCAPLALNCLLVRYARVLAMMAKEIGLPSEARRFAERADKRTALIRQYCWNENAGLFFEYDFVAGRQLPYISECAWWTMWAGVASRRQAERLAGNLHLLEERYGLSVTDKAYPDPHPATAYLLQDGDGKQSILDFVSSEAPDFIGGRGPLMWMYPAGWATTQIICCAGLDAYGYSHAANRISGRFLSVVIEQYQKTGQLWEKYNVVDGALVLPNSRYGNIPYHSFTAAAVVLLGRRFFQSQTLRLL